ncbi:DEAD/DEAH box helicase [Shinella sp.]|uniref:DEAD/DEAH box helicase n=1 Tax=Shinella sp. TaxID=1870904 RepID=UPI0039E5346D
MNEIVPNIDTDLDVIFGEYRHHATVELFVKGVRDANLTGTLYIGYPVLAVDDDKIEFDAVLVSRDRGVVIFDLYSFDGQAGGELEQTIPEAIVNRQEQLYAALYNRLNSFGELRRGRSLLIKLTTATIHPMSEVLKQEGESLLIGLDRLSDLDIVPSADRPNDEQVEHLNAAIQRISNLKPKKKRANVVRNDSKGYRIKEIEKKIANLDLWQKRGSIEYVNGPQRIRGLAGSGKTVVLALKAAYLHVKRPDWDIVITFNTRSLYQQFEALVTRFVFAQINDEPDWKKLHIKHAWGGSDRTGVYREYTGATGANYRDFATASRLFGYENAFAGACQEALNTTSNQELELYDMILIDEAQDLPSDFFKLVYRMVKDPKRIVWAYDDLQNLGDTHLPSARDLFGVDEYGRPHVDLRNEIDQPQQDIVLPRCYRNPPWTLLSAHGLGFGVHRQPMAQMFTDPNIWTRLGYVVRTGQLNFDKNVSVKRAPESIPEFFTDLLSPADTLIAKKFDSGQQQYEWVAKQIKKLVAEDELEYSDMLIVLPNVRTNKSESAKMLRALMAEGLQGHIPGQTSSRDEVFQENSIAITHIFRAKGNEAPVIFLVNADFCEGQYGIKQRRNILFTAITRSRAWTYILGTGPGIDQIFQELEEIRKADFSLDFHYPRYEDAVALAVSTDTLYPDEAGGPDDFNDIRAAVQKARSKWEQLPLDLRQELSQLHGDAQ